MRIPSAKATDPSRETFLLDLCRKCEVSMASRREDYARRRDYFLYGSGGGDPARFNKIRPQLETLVSFIYSAETTRFSVNAGASLSAPEKALALAQIPTLNRKLQDRWLDSNADQVFRLAVLWGSVFDTMLVKLVVRGNEIVPYLVEPACFGVLREDIPGLDRQEAFVHSYYITASEMALHLLNHPQKAAILAAVTAAPKPAGSELGDRINRVLISQINPALQGVTGSPWDWNQFTPYSAEVEENVIGMKDLYVWDDAENDYRMITIAEPGIVVYDNPCAMAWIKGEHPFIQVAPDPVYDFFWGFSDVEKLAGLQDMYNTRIEQIIKIMNKQADPPAAGRGLTDEQNFAAQIAAGFVRLEDNGNLQLLEPDMPEDLFRELDRITEMFSDALGINNVLAGRGEAGVRSKGHAAELARLGSSRIKQRALVIEDALEKMAGLYLKAMQKYDKTHYSDEQQREFIAAQFTPDHFVKVDAHSNSPIFVEDNRALAFDLFKLKVITAERLLELVDPPMKQQLLEDSKKLMAQQTQQAQMAAQQKAGSGVPVDNAQ